MVQLRRSTRSWSGLRLARLALAGAVVPSLALAMSGCSKDPVPAKPHPIEVLPARSLTRAWAVDLKLADSDPILMIDVRDELVYVYTKNHHVFAVDRKSGQFKYSIKVYAPTRDPLRPLVELADKVVFPNATTMEVYDFDGNHLRSVRLNKSLSSNATGSGQSLYFGASGNHGGLVESYDMSNDPATVAAPFKWEFLPKLGGQVESAPIEFGGIVYSGSTHGEVDAVSTKRDVVWDTDQNIFLVGDQLTSDRAPLADNSIKADLRVDESGVYAVSENGSMFCINRGTGKLLWQYFAGAHLQESPVLASDSVYLKVPGKGIVALDKGNKGAFNREPRWTRSTATQFLAQDSRYAYVAEESSKSDDGVQMYKIIAVDKTTGVKAFESDRDDFTTFGSNRKDNMIYTGFADGTFMAVVPVLKPGTIGELVMGTGGDVIAFSK